VFRTERRSLRTETLKKKKERRESEKEEENFK